MDDIFTSNPPSVPIHPQQNQTRPPQTRTRVVSRLIPASGICLRLIDSFVEVRRGCERDDNINDDGESDSPEKKKFRWGLDKRREIPEKVCLMHYRIRAAMSDGMRMKVLSLLWSTYNTNNTGTSQ